MSRFLISENVCMPTGNRFSLFISMLVFAAFRAYSPAKLRFYSETGKGSKGKNRERIGEGANRPVLRVTGSVYQLFLSSVAFNPKFLSFTISLSE